MELKQDELAHWGVLGMKWGVRKKEPTAAEARADRAKASEKQAKRNVKAQKYVDRAKSFDVRINQLQSKSYRNAFTRGRANKEILELREYRAQALKDAELKKKGKLSTNQKKAVIGGAIVATVVAAVVIKNGTESGEFNRLAQKGKAMINGKDATEFAKNADLARKDLSVDDIANKVVKQVNPNFGDIGTKMNCRRSTFAYEMRRRGFDVKATRTTNAYGQNGAGLLNAISPGAKEKRTDTFGVVQTALKEQAARNKNPSSAVGPLSEITAAFNAGAKNPVIRTESAPELPAAIFETLTKQPSGSRGELGITWASGGGHSLAYEIINGKTVVFDAQSGKVFQNAEEFTKAMGQVSASGFTRLDNVELNTNYLLKWLKNA